MGFCTDGYVEIYEIKPQPEDMGAFFLAHRMKYAKKVVQLRCGMTAGGAKTIISAFNKRIVNLAALLREVEVKGRRSVNVTPLLSKNG